MKHQAENRKAKDKQTSERRLLTLEELAKVTGGVNLKQQPLL